MAPSEHHKWWVCPYELCDNSGFVTFTKRVFIGTGSERVEEFSKDCRCRPELKAAMKIRAAHA